MKFPELNTIFVHIPKTGGTTITYSIWKNIRKRDKGTQHQTLTSLYSMVDRRIVKRNVRKAHVHAIEYKRILKKEYDKFYRFTLVREPFSHIRSLYKQLTYMNLKQNARFRPYRAISFEEFVMNEDRFSMVGENDYMVDQTKFLLDRKSRLLVDDVFIFEYFNESVDIISKKLGVTIDKSMVLRSTTSDDLYSPEMINRVLDKYGHVYDFYKKAKRNFEKKYL